MKVLSERMCNGWLKFSWLMMCLLSCTAYANTASDWHLEKQEEQITVYSKEKADSEFLQIKVEALLSANIAAVISHFGDKSECWDWQERCLSLNVVKEINLNEKLVHTVIDMPWPLTSRDFLLHSSVNVDPTTKIVTLALRPYSEKELDNGVDLDTKSEFVRGKSDVVYTMEPISKSSTKLTILMHTELGGDIPPSFVNSRLADDLYGSTVFLRSLLNQSKN